MSTWKVTFIQRRDAAVNQMIRLLQDLLLQKEGQTLYEYSLILLLIVIATIVAVSLLGDQVVAFITRAAGAI